MTERPVNPDADVDGDETLASTGTLQGDKIVGPYHLLQLVGEGGMGEVWLAEQKQPVRRQVALKLIKAGMDTARVVARFEAERQALALMDHPAIARVFDAGASRQGRPYFAMEYVRGEPITTYCARHKLSMLDRIGLFLQVCEGVQHAHQKGIVHRDLKPSNVLVTLQADRPVPKIIDFGVAKAITQTLTDRTLHTELGTLLGTPEYMSPEQAEMTGLDIDTRTDVYALGVILYELLTGVLPFEALREKGLDEIRRTIREVDPPRPSTRVSTTAASADAAPHVRAEARRLTFELRGDLDWITMKALEKDRTRRYGSASDLGADLQRHLEDQPVLASPPSTVYRAQKFVRRNRLAVAMVTAVIVLLVGFGATMVVQARRIALERDRANRETGTATQVSDFLVGLFNVSDPSEARGNTLTAREILATGAAKIERELGDQPEVQARLMATIGRVYQSLGLFGAAEPLLQRALVTARRALGENHPQTLAAVNELANLYWYQDRLKEAEPLYLEVVERRRRALGEEHPDTLRANFDLASLYGQQKRWSEAERVIRATLETQRRVLGDNHSDTLRSMSQLASQYYGQARYAEALALEAKATEIRRATLGEDHLDTILGAHNLATDYFKLGRFGEAETTFLKAIEAKRRVLGPAHPSTILTTRRFAEMYQQQKRYDEAESQLQGAFDALSNTPGADVTSVQSVVTQLADLYSTSGKSAQAAEWRAKLRNKAAPSR